MKKFLALVLALCMVFALCACGKQTYTLGMGTVVSTDYTSGTNAQVDATVAAVVTDVNGKIVACRIDCAQNKMDVTAVDFAKAFLSKVELGDNYNMVTYGAAIAEWYAQAEAFEAYVVGKTGAEVAAIETVVNEEGYDVATDEALLAGCTISITDFKEAVAKACADNQGMPFEASGDFTVGIAAISDASESVAAGAEAGSINMYSEFAAVVLGADGKILATVNDAIQPKIAYTAKGVGDITFKGTKRELKEDYNMVTYGAAIAEWYEQSLAFSQYCVGKTGAEVAAIETVVNEEGHNVATDDALLAGCTMSISGMMAVVAQAANYAR